MQIATFSIRGFRSLQDVGPLSMRNPTILAGHNDSGKTACIDALAYLLGSYQLKDEDRTYTTTSTPPTELDDAQAPQEVGEPASRRVTETWVEGTFLTTNVEQEYLGLPEHVAVRRVSRASGQSVLEVLLTVPQDVDLRDLSQKRVPDLRELARRYGVTPAPGAGSPTKADWIKALESYAEAQPQATDWTTAPADLTKALPRLLRFGDADAADQAVKAALTNRYKHHLEDPDLREMSALKLFPK